MHKLLVAAALGTTALVGAAVAAQTTSVRLPKTDANGDGAVTRAEFLDHAGAEFARMDLNHDGTLTRDERHASHAAKRQASTGLDSPAMAAVAPPAMAIAAQDAPPPAGAGQDGTAAGTGAARMRMLQRLDTDHDGKITRAEYDAGTASRFQRLDANGDGVISADERAQPGAGAGGGGGMGARMLDRLDSDGDGKITRAEYSAEAGDRFARLDMNDDGVIDAAEMSTAGDRTGARAGRGVRRRSAVETPAAPPPPPPRGG